ncbi:hypothetical protein CRI64_00925 [Escherichia sp. E2748]|nr:hypothetical protein CRI64_00925 [Escherichia sp. E2748]
MEKTPPARTFPGTWLLGHMFFPVPSPDSVDHRSSSFESEDSARRSRTTERSESVSEEAEETPEMANVLLTHLCGISHQTWYTFLYTTH